MPRSSCRGGGRLSFVVSSAILFSNYGIPLIRFLGRHYRICAVVDSMVERWFPDADTNTILLLLEREEDQEARENKEVRFVRLRRPLANSSPIRAMRIAAAGSKNCSNGCSGRG